MITGIDFREVFGSFNSSLINIDLINKDVTYFKNEVIQEKNKLKVDRQSFKELVRSYVIYWDNEYVDNASLDGSEAELTIYTDDEVIRYHFKNKYPINYHAFLEELKTMVGGS